MPVITTSLVTMVKGAIFLSKTSASKMIVAKLAQIVTTKTFVDAVAAACVVTTAAGVFVVASSIPKRAVGGFEKLVKGIEGGNFTDFSQGVVELAGCYSTTASLIGDFNVFVDGYQGSSEVKISLKKSIQDVSCIIEDQIEHKCFNLMREVENTLRKKGLTPEAYLKSISDIYAKHTFDLKEYCSYFDFLGRCGRIYSDISRLNKKYGITKVDEYDHYLVYCIAGWLVDNVKLPCMRGKTQKQLAQDITDQIFAYLHAYRLG